MHVLDFSGQTAVVTGAAKGIGYATAKRLVESGAAVSLWDFDGAALVEAEKALGAKGEVHTACVDCADEASIDVALRSTMDWRNSIDVMVANASVVGVMKPAWEHTLDEWNRLLRLDLTSAFLTIRAVVPGMIERGYGRIVTVSSAAGLIATPNNLAYAVAKAGVVSLTRTFGKELGGTGVTINTVAPSGIKTTMLDGLTEDYLAAVMSAHALNKLASPEEVAAMIAWVAGRECSHTTGAVFDCAAGRLS